MGIRERLKRIRERCREKRDTRDAQCEQRIAETEAALQAYSALFDDTQAFVEPGRADRWLKQSSAVLLTVSPRKGSPLKKAARYKTLVSRLRVLQEKVNTLDRKVAEHNRLAGAALARSAYKLIGEVEGKKLDSQQMLCIVRKAHNHLVVAGAGTGKTTTVVGKIKFLLLSGECRPEDILVLSFTNASASEMRSRIRRETGVAIEASTFHKLGLNILTAVNGVVPKITQLSLRKFVKEQLLQQMKNEPYLRLLIAYWLHGRVASRSEFDFRTSPEYQAYLKLNPPVTLRKETVRSYGEMDIANFLFQNGVRYLYEAPYRSDTRTAEYGQYRPDFYLPDYGIYIEYFGINRSGEVPSYFSGGHGMSATEAYHAAMRWKREIHRTNRTPLIECYAYEKQDGTLLENLKKELERHSVRLAPLPAAALWNEISAGSATALDGITELLETLINLIKNNGYTVETVRLLNQNSQNKQKNALLLSLLDPIWEAYCRFLKEHDEIDFNDMINAARECVESGRYVNPYSYVIVDEYQDISKARFLLLHALRASRDFDLFCVGDDWQSIYRFAGSDLGYLLNFRQYWGPAEISKIETTYRFSQKLIEVSSDFIMRNPSQIRKEIRGVTENTGFALEEISGYTEKAAIQMMAARLADLPENSSVFLIGRYSFDVEMLQKSGLFDCQYRQATGFIEVKSPARRDLKMNFVTAHRSKGLQADYVFILNNKKSRLGFPSKVQDADILNLLLESRDSYPYAEERRLFYVALTRARKKVFLVTVSRQESEFITELRRRFGRELALEAFTCPRCGGRLIKKTGPYGTFLGCSNYSAGCRYRRNLPQESRKRRK